MEDPWVNAWGDSQKSPPDNPTKPPPITSTWSITDDQEDIAVPSWEPDSGTIWDDSPDLQKDLWSRDNRASQLWTAPTLESIAFAKPSQESLSLRHPQTPPRTPSPQPSEPPDPGGNDGLELSGTQDVNPQSSTLDSAPEPASVSEARESTPEQSDDASRDDEGEAPDINPSETEGFGTFEGAGDDYAQSDPWAPSHQVLPQIEDAGEWGETWKDPEDVPADDNSEPPDEWELAKRQKEMQDHYVPPELLGSIQRQFDEFSENYWPEEQSGDHAYQLSHDELADTLDISSIIDRVIPSDLTLPASTPFAKTFIWKEMTEAIKLTRHHVVTRNSPLAVYMNTKGSLSWEAAIKSKSDVTEADVVPSGWRIVPKENTEQHQPMNDSKKKAPGGLLSFFGRKSTTTAPSSGSSSPVRSSTPVGASPRASTTSPRPSIDVSLATSAVTKATTSPSGKDADVVPSATMSALVEITSPGKADAQIPSTEIEESVQAPSAVSRFFGRFSRSNRSSTGAANVQNSIALSTDDLEFLSDIVPNANDDMDDFDKLNVLSTTIRAPSVPTKLPPPLAPPPRAPPLPKPLSPPPFVSSQPISPTSKAPSSGSRPNTMAGSIESQLIGLVPGSSQIQSRPPSQTIPASPFTMFPIQPPVPPVLLPPPPAPLSPVTMSRSHTSASQPPKTPRRLSNSLFDDNDFSDFQTSPGTTSAVLMGLDSTFGSFTSSAPPNPPQTHGQPTSFDDFDDFVSPPPPQVPEKPNSIPFRSIPPPGTSPIKSASPTKQSNIHERRLSKQADSDQRTLNLLETAATRGKWPAPPSPLPNAIPPPPTSKSAGTKFFDAFEELGGPSSSIAALNTGSSLSSLSNTISSPALLAAPPPTEVAISRNATGASSPGNGPGLGGVRSPGPSAPTAPPPLIPPHPPNQPALAPPKSQTQSRVQPSGNSLPMQQQWRIPSPPSAKPLPTFAQPSSTSLGFGNSGSSSAHGSRSGTPSIQPPLQQQKLAVDVFSSLFDPAKPTALQTPGSPSNQNPSSSGGKLSAQDLSFFEGL